MEFLPKEPVFDDTLYSEQMHEALSDTAKLARSIQNPPRKRFDRQIFLEAMQEAYEQIGGVRRLTLWADKNETEFYRLYAKTIPQAQLLDIQGRMQMQILPALPPSELDGDYIDATPSSGGEQGSLSEKIHVQSGGPQQLSGPEAASGSRVQHVPPKASGGET